MHWERGFWKTEEEEEEACTRTSLKLSWIFGVLHWSSIDFLKPGLEVWNKGNKGVSQEEGVNRFFSWQKSEVSEAKKLQWKRVCWPCYPERLFHNVLVLSTQVSATEKKEKKTPPAITHQHNTKIFGLECNFFPAKMQCSSHSFTTYKPLEWIKSQSELNSNTFQFFCFFGCFFSFASSSGCVQCEHSCSTSSQLHMNHDHRMSRMVGSFLQFDRWFPEA